MYTPSKPAADPASPYLSRKATAGYLGVSVETLDRWRRLGLFDCGEVRVGRFVRFLRADVERWLAAHRA